MHDKPAPSRYLETLAAADRLARAASLWLRQEAACGFDRPRPGPEHRELLAGLVTGIGHWLQQDEEVTALAAYALALLEQEGDNALQLPERIGDRQSAGAAYAEGLQAASRLIAAVGPVAAARPAARR